MSQFEQFLFNKGNEIYFHCRVCDVDTRLFFPEKIEIFACKCGKIHSRSHFEKYEDLSNIFYRKELLEMGAKATLDDTVWEIVGIANKFNEKNNLDRWVEYVMCDEKNGKFSFLNCSYGNYTWFFETDDIKVEVKDNFPNSINYQGINYRQLASYQYQSNSIFGAFPYDCVNTPNYRCCDYIAPPTAISVEVDDSDGSISVFKGRHVSRKEIAQIFDDERLRYQTHEGVGLAQPFFGGINVLLLTRIALGFVVLLTLLHFFVFNPMFDSNRITHFTFDVSSGEEKELITQSFILPKQTLNHYLTVEGVVNLSNEWLETGITLVNESTGDERELGLVFEHYSGSGWEEGSDHAETGISNVPSGRYHLKIKTYTGILTDKNVYLSLSEANPTNWNFVLLILVTLFVLIVLFIANGQFERMRRGEIDTFFGSSE